MASKRLYRVTYSGKSHATEKQPELRRPYARNALFATMCGKEIPRFTSNGDVIIPQKGIIDCKACLKALAS